MLPLKPSKSKSIVGMDERLYPEINHMKAIVNYRVDSNGAFRNNVGWEPLIKELAATVTISVATYKDLFAATRFLYVWPRHQNGEVYYLYERYGDMQYELGNGTATTGGDTYTILSGRTDPKPDDPGTQVSPYGRLLVIADGKTLYKFWGRQLVETFGWNTRPSTPQVLDVYPPAANTAGSYYIDGNATCLRFDSQDYPGIGLPTLNYTSTYGYKVAFISNTGSMSPLSDAYYVGWLIDNNEVDKYGVTITDLPTGPRGTVARIIFRTKNKLSGQSYMQDEFFQVARINDNITTTWIDTIPEGDLGSTAIDPTLSIPIDATYKYVAVWDDRVWLAGGDTHGQTCVYSEKGLPEQFAQFNYFNLGLRDGGQATALVPYYNSLLIFRERAIDLVTASTTGSYSITTLDANVGTTATNTVKLVPGIGVLFLAKDGVYRISGGLYGGSEYKVEHFSGQLSEEWDRITTGCMARATATYSSKEGEYWVHYPCDGQTENTRGAVFHLQTEGWSLRNANGYERGSMNFTYLATDPQGWIIMGTRPEYASSLTPLGSNSFPGIGLQVWSAEAHWGQTWTNPVFGGEGWTYTIGWATRGNSLLESPWESADGDWYQRESVKSIFINTVGDGNNSVQLQYAVDNLLDYTTEVATSTQQSEYYGSTTAQTVLATDTTGPAATWNSTKWEAIKLNVMRHDIDAQEAGTFSWKINTSNDFSIISYQLRYNTKNAKSINQRG